MSKYKDIEHVVSFFLSSATEELSENLPFRTERITTSAQAIGIIATAIADAKKEMPPRSTNDLYNDAYYMAVAVIAKRKTQAPKSIKNLRKLMGTDVEAQVREEISND